MMINSNVVLLAAILIFLYASITLWFSVQSRSQLRYMVFIPVVLTVLSYVVSFLLLISIP